MNLKKKRGMGISDQYRFTLEKGSKKYPCPSCGKPRDFVRYLDTETGEYLPDQYGRCDRAEHCGYHLNPYKDGFGKAAIKPSFGENFQPPRAEISTKNKRPDTLTVNGTSDHVRGPILIPGEVLETTIKNGYDYNTFIQNLLHRVRYPFLPDDISRVIALYRLGSVKSGYRKGSVTFPFIDENGGIRAVQVKQFDNSNHTTGTDWLHSIVAKYHQENKTPLPEWLESYQKNDLKVSCLFGAHLLHRHPPNRIALVEAPKTAIYGTLYFGLPEGQDNLLWLAVYSRDSLTVEKCRAIQGRTVYLFPDLSKDGSTFKLWQAKADEIMKALPGTRIVISNMLEMAANKVEREKGNDLADYLIQLDWRLFRNRELTREKRKDDPIVPKSKHETPANLQAYTESKDRKPYSPPLTYHPGAWSEEIKGLENFFEAVTLPDGPFKINPFTPVGNPRAFLDANIETAKAQNGNPVYRSYLVRAQLLMEYLKKEKPQVDNSNQGAILRSLNPKNILQLS